MGGGDEVWEGSVLKNEKRFPPTEPGGVGSWGAEGEGGAAGWARLKNV